MKRCLNNCDTIWIELCEVSAGTKVGRVKVGDGVFAGRFASILKRFVVKLDDFLPATEGFCTKMNDEYFLKCASVRYPPAAKVCHNFEK